MQDLSSSMKGYPATSHSSHTRGKGRVVGGDGGGRYIRIGGARHLCVAGVRIVGSFIHFHTSTTLYFPYLPVPSDSSIPIPISISYSIRITLFTTVSLITTYYSLPPFTIAIHHRYSLSLSVYSSITIRMLRLTHSSSSSHPP